MWLKIKRLILRLLTRHSTFKTYRGYVGSHEVWKHERWWQLFSRKKQRKVTRIST